jgi:hypothetical protein
MENRLLVTRVVLGLATCVYFYTACKYIFFVLFERIQLLYPFIAFSSWVIAYLVWSFVEKNNKKGGKS